MIEAFKDQQTEKVWHGEVSRRKLRMLNNARTLDDLRIPPANRLEALKGRRRGQHSIRFNDQ